MLPDVYTQKGETVSTDLDRGILAGIDRRILSGVGNDERQDGQGVGRSGDVVDMPAALHGVCRWGAKSWDRSVTSLTPSPARTRTTGPRSAPS